MAGRPNGLTSAEVDVINAATRVVDGDPARYPFLTDAVNRLHRQRRGLVDEEEFCYRLLAASVRPLNTLKRSYLSIHDMLFTAKAADVTDVRGSGYHTWACWFLTAETFGIRPPWVDDMEKDPTFVDRVAQERKRIDAECPGWGVRTPERNGVQTRGQTDWCSCDWDTDKPGEEHKRTSFCRPSATVRTEYRPESNSPPRS